MFHTQIPVRRILTIAVAAYVVLVAIFLAAGISVVEMNYSSQQAAERASSKASADALVSAIATYTREMQHATLFMVGFALSAGPLVAPQYTYPNGTTVNATQRLTEALAFGTPSAMSRSAFDRIYASLSARLSFLTQIDIAPGLVNWMGVTALGEDLYSALPAVVAAMVATGSPVVGVPSPDLLCLYAPVFNVTGRDGGGGSLATLWGAVTIGIQPTWAFAGANPRQVIGTEADACLFAQAGNETPSEVTLAASSPAVTDCALNATSVAETACVKEPLFTWLCVRVWQIDPSNGLAAKTLGAAVALSLVSAAVIVALCAVIMYCVLDYCSTSGAASGGTVPDGPPFFLVCVDLCHASRLWTETPYAAAAALRTLSEQVARMARTRNLYVAQSVGSTSIVISSDPESIMRLGRDLLIWSRDGAGLPGEILGQLPHSRLSVSIVVHYTNDAEVQQLPPTEDGGEIGTAVLSDDFWLLLSMRPAAVPDSIVATRAFLDAALDHYTHIRRLTGETSSSSAVLLAARHRHGGGDGDMVSSEASLEPLARGAESVPFLGPVKRLGVCSAQLRVDTEPFDVEGFLVTAEEGTSLDAVFDGMPESVIVEWRASTAPRDRPEGAAAPLENPSQSAGGSLSTRDALHMVVMHHSDSDVSSSAHITAVGLPGCAVDLADAKKLTAALLDMGAGVVTRVAARRDNSHVVRRRMSSSVEHVRRLQQLTSLASHQLCALRVVFSPVDAETRAAVVQRICAAVGVPYSSEGGLVYVAARCAFLGFDDFSPNPPPLNNDNSSEQASSTASAHQQSPSAPLSPYHNPFTPLC